MKMKDFQIKINLKISNNKQRTFTQFNKKYKNVKILLFLNKYINKILYLYINKYIFI